jgi:hypothetical protein
MNILRILSKSMFHIIFLIINIIVSWLSVSFFKLMSLTYLTFGLRDCLIKALNVFSLLKHLLCCRIYSRALKSTKNEKIRDNLKQGIISV